MTPFACRESYVRCTAASATCMPTVLPQLPAHVFAGALQIFQCSVLGRDPTWGANMSRGCALGPPAAAGADACAPAAWPPAAGAAAPSPAPGGTDKHQCIAIPTAAHFLAESGSRTEAAAALSGMPPTKGILTVLASVPGPWVQPGVEGLRARRWARPGCRSLTGSPAPGLLLRHVQALRDARHEVLDGPVGVVERRAQGAHHVFPGKAHLADLHGALITFLENTSHF